MTTERLNQSNERIKESRRTMLETEELGVSILQDLHQQRQSLLHAHNTVCFTAQVHFFIVIIGRGGVNSFFPPNICRIMKNYITTRC